jgi:preprotein translocase subunit SecG
MATFKIILTVIQVIISVVLVAVVLIQSGKEAGLSSAISGNQETFLGKGKSKGLDKILAASTKWVALAWGLVTLGLCLLTAAGF